MYFSQGDEERVVIDYFKDRKITFLDCGSNDGKTLSNTYALSLLGNFGICIEASPAAFDKLYELHGSNPLIELFNVAISDKCGEVTLYHSGSHLTNQDISLLSTVNKKETERWGNENFEEIKVHATTMDKILKQVAFETIEFISIDIEGSDMLCLYQLDLVKLKTECLCIEHNGSMQVLNQVKKICNEAGMTKVLLKNNENIIYAK